MAASKQRPDASQHADLDREAIKAHYQAERGYWRPWNEALLDENPRFLQRYASYAGHPAKAGPLSVKQVELIYVALDASATHLFGSGLSLHMGKALSAGATPAEIFDVLHRVAAQGLNSVYQATAILAEEAATRMAGGVREDMNMVTAALVGLSSEQIDRVHRLGLPASAAALSLIAQTDPGFLPVLLDFLEFGRPDAGLSDADRCLIDVALSACFTGFDPQTLRLRIRAALDQRLSTHAVLEAIQLGAHLAVHGTALGAGAYAELRGKQPG